MPSTCRLTTFSIFNLTTTHPVHVGDTVRCYSLSFADGISSQLMREQLKKRRPVFSCCITIAPMHQHQFIDNVSIPHIASDSSLIIYSMYLSLFVSITTLILSILSFQITLGQKALPHPSHIPLPTSNFINKLSYHTTNKL